MTNPIMKYLKSRPNKWANVRDFVDDPKLNRKLNYTILLLEFLFIVYAINSVYDCPCAYRTCGIKHYDTNTRQMDWEASNLDCKFVQDYIARNRFMGRDDNPDMTNPKSFKSPWNSSGLIAVEMPQ